jgi:fatty acid desaturase
MSSLNLGNLDRALRVLIGVALIGLAAFGTIGAWGCIGIVPLVTGLWGLCPLYKLFGWSTTSR